MACSHCAVEDPHGADHSSPASFQSYSITRLAFARDQTRSSLKLKMWLGPESNRRHADFQSAALPTELPSREDGHLSRKDGPLNPPSRIHRRGRRKRRRQNFFQFKSASADCAAGLKFSRQIDGTAQQFQILPAWNLDRAELLQMGSDPLGIKQDKLSRAQTFDQPDQGDFGSVEHPMKH